MCVCMWRWGVEDELEGFWGTAPRCGLPEPSHGPCITRAEALREGKAFLAQARMLCPLAATTARLFGICPRPMTQQRAGMKMMMYTVPRGQCHGFRGPDPYLLSLWLPPAPRVPLLPRLPGVPSPFSSSVRKTSKKGGCGGSSSPAASPQHLTGSGSD